MRAELIDSKVRGLDIEETVVVAPRKEKAETDAPVATRTAIGKEETMVEKLERKNDVVRGCACVV